MRESIRMETGRKFNPDIREAYYRGEHREQYTFVPRITDLALN